MSQIHEQFITLVQQIADNKEKLHQFINGTAEETITTDEGDIPTLSGIYEELIANGGIQRSPSEVASIAHSATPFWTPSEETETIVVDYNDDGGSTAGISVASDDTNLIQYQYTDDQQPNAVAKAHPAIPLDGNVIKIDSNTTTVAAALADPSLSASEVFTEISANDASGKIYLQAVGGNVVVQNNGAEVLNVACALPAYLAFSGGPGALVISVYDSGSNLVGATSALDISSLPDRAWFSMMGGQLGHAASDTATIDFSAAGWSGNESPAINVSQTTLSAPEGAVGSGREYRIEVDATALGIEYKKDEVWRFPFDGGDPYKSASANALAGVEQKAEKAQSTADDAQDTANSAQTAANTAQSTADDAQQAVDSLGSMADETKGTGDPEYQTNAENRAEFSPAKITEKVVAGTAYEVTDADNGLGLVFTSSSPVLVTLDSDAQAGVQCLAIRAPNSALVTFQTENGENLASTNPEIGADNAGVALWRRNSNTWWVG
ncbi:MAG: hypothetical protein ACQES2_05020 [Pseudomonadota bacterium]